MDGTAKAANIDYLEQRIIDVLFAFERARRVGVSPSRQHDSEVAMREEVRKLAVAILELSTD